MTVKKLLAEGYPLDQAIAIAYAKAGKGKKKKKSKELLLNKQVIVGINNQGLFYDY